MWNKQPIQGNYESIKWLTPMKLTQVGKKHLVGERLRDRNAVFVGFTKDGFYKILLENSSCPYSYSKTFWEKN